MTHAHLLTPISPEPRAQAISARTAAAEIIAAALAAGDQPRPEDFAADALLRTSLHPCTRAALSAAGVPLFLFDGAGTAFIGRTPPLDGTTARALWDAARQADDLGAVAAVVTQLPADEYARFGAMFADGSPEARAWSAAIAG